MPLSREALLERQLGRLQRRLDHALVEDLLGALAEIAVGVLLHPRHHQPLVERAAVDPDAHRLALLDGDPADGRELLVALAPEADVAGVDPVLVERGRAGGVAGEQQVAVVVEVADQRHVAAGVEQAPPDLGHRGGGCVQVDGDAHQLGAGARQLQALARGRHGVGRVGVGHRLHHHRRAAADDDLADADRMRGAAGRGGHALERSRPRPRGAEGYHPARRRCGTIPVGIGADPAVAAVVTPASKTGLRGWTTRRARPRSPCSTRSPARRATACTSGRCCNASPRRCTRSSTGSTSASRGSIASMASSSARR